MKAKRRFNIWLWVLLCVPCLLASCDHDVHNDEEEGGVVNEHGNHCNLF